MEKKNISIGLAQAMTRHLKENGYKMESGRLTSPDGIIAKVRLDGCVELSVEGMDDTKVLGPFSSMANFRVSLKKEVLFNRYLEIDTLEGNPSKWSQMLHGIELRDDKEVEEFLKYISPVNHSALFYEFNERREKYYPWVPMEDRFGKNYPFSGRELLQELADAMDGDPDWHDNIYYDVQEALYGFRRTEISDWDGSVKRFPDDLAIDRHGTPYVAEEEETLAD